MIARHAATPSLLARVVLCSAVLAIQAASLGPTGLLLSVSPLYSFLARNLSHQFPSHTDFHGICYSPEVIHNYLLDILVKLGCYVNCTVAEQYQIGRQQMQRRGSYVVNGKMFGVRDQLAGEGGRAVVCRSTNIKKHKIRIMGYLGSCV